MAKAAKRPLAVLNMQKLRKLANFMLKVVGIKNNIKNNNCESVFTFSVNRNRVYDSTEFKETINQIGTYDNL
jgi:hypothetical protein